jgi:hypothetical protein
MEALVKLPLISVVTHTQYRCTVKFDGSFFFEWDRSCPFYERVFNASIPRHTIATILESLECMQSLRYVTYTAGIPPCVRASRS